LRLKKLISALGNWFALDFDAKMIYLVRLETLTIPCGGKMPQVLAKAVGDYAGQAGLCFRAAFWFGLETVRPLLFFSFRR